MIRTFTLDTEGWSDDEVQLIPATVTGMLFLGGYDYIAGSVRLVKDGTYEVGLTGEFPFTAEQIRERIHEDDATRDASAL